MAARDSSTPSPSAADRGGLVHQTLGVLLACSSAAKEMALRGELVVKCIDVKDMRGACVVLAEAGCIGLLEFPVAQVGYWRPVWSS
jgi:hypothetical protein